MKKLILLFALVLFATTAQSQSLTQKDVTGTWLVVQVENSNNNPQMAASMDKSILNFNADASFEIKAREAQGTSFTTTSQKNATWTFNASTQTITTTRTKMTLKITQSGNKIYFTDTVSGLVFEVIKPV